MKTSSSRNWLTALVVALAACIFVTVSGWLIASPSDDINSAVVAGGNKDVKATDPDAFLNAFTSVLVSVGEEESAAYAKAATQLRPDLADQIASVADEVDNAPEDGDSDEGRRRRHHRVSQHRRQVQICCSMHTLTLPAQKARFFLATRQTCHVGACHSHHYGHHQHHPGE